MCVPVIRLLLQQHKDVEISFVSDKKFAPLFSNINNCHFIGAELKGSHRGLTGLFRLYRQITSGQKIHAVADLHQVLRTQVLKLFFFMSGKKIFSIDKGRAEKKKLTAKENKSFHQLTTSFQRYADVFQQMGYPISIEPSSLHYSKLSLPESASVYFQNKKCIGIAPFAKHKEKMYPLEKMKKIIAELSKSDVTILLFGGGKTEKDLLDTCFDHSKKNVINITGQYRLEEELAIISHLSLMCSMDSANMHLASLYNLPVVSIWGATHPFAGFLGWNQSEENVMSVDLPCRPCSVYGNKECWRGDHACMEGINPEKIISRIQYLLSK